MGEPVPSNVGTLRSEYIGPRSETRGSETSQYPEEEKTTVIPSVVASESGTAQTIPLAGWGCGTLIWLNAGIAERHGKADQRG